MPPNARRSARSCTRSQISTRQRAAPALAAARRESPPSPPALLALTLEVIFGEVTPHLETIMNGPFGNYLFQQLVPFQVHRNRVLGPVEYLHLVAVVLPQSLIQYFLLSKVLNQALAFLPFHLPWQFLGEVS